MKLSIFKTMLIVIAVISLTAVQLYGQAPDTLWTKTFGGSANDEGLDVIQTSDGGYAVAGHTGSYGAYIADFLLVKTDGSGSMQWQHTYGWGYSDCCYSVQQTDDGGYVMAGLSDPLGSWGFTQVLLVRADANGNQAWIRNFGGAWHDDGYCVQQTADGGFVIVGKTSSYGAGGYDVWLIKTDSAGNRIWDRTFGGSGTDYGIDVKQTTDLGYIISGYTTSWGSGGYDALLIKTDANGNEIWHNTFGGSGDDKAEPVQQTSDGGYALAGWTGSNAWLIKTDASGNKLWERTFGGSGGEAARSMQQTADGGYVLGGYTTSYGSGGYDVWIVKTDDAGNMEWNLPVGGSSTDHGYSIIQTSDGGYAVAGITLSYGSGGEDFWLIRLGTPQPTTGDISGTVTKPSPPYSGMIVYLFDSNRNLLNSTQTAVDGSYSFSDLQPGNYLVELVIPLGYHVYPYEVPVALSAGQTAAVDFPLTPTTGQPPQVLWTQSYGGPGDNDAMRVKQTTDNGFIMTTNNYSGSPINGFGLIKTDASGNQMWTDFYNYQGWTTGGVCYSVQQTSDGGYIMAGYSSSSAPFGNDEVLLVKVNSLGGQEWIRHYGGNNHEYGHSVRQTPDGGYIIAGFTYSFGAGDNDVWLIRTDAQGNILWDRTFGGSESDWAIGVELANDGGFIIAATTASYGAGDTDFWLIKTDDLGNELWNRAYGGESTEEAACVQPTTDGGYIISGYTSSYGTGGWDCWLVKTDDQSHTQWDRAFGDCGEEWGRYVQETNDGGFIVVGHTTSLGAGSYDVFVVKTDVNGNEEWYDTYGGYNVDIGYCIQALDDGEYIISGLENSFGAGDVDAWLIRLGTPPTLGNIAGSLTPLLMEITINLYDASNVLIDTTQTSGSGTYSFPELTPGSYFVDLIPPAGYAVPQNHMPVAVVAGQTTTADFTLTLLPGVIQGHVTPTYSGITIGVTGSNQFYASTLTDYTGFYQFVNLTGNSTYTVDLVLPLGFICSGNSVLRYVMGGTTETVDFTLTPIAIINNARGKGYWKHQVNANLSGNGSTDDDSLTLLGFSEEIFEHFYGNAFNPIQIDGVTYVDSTDADSTHVPLKMTDLQYILNINQGGSTKYERACQHYLTLLLNVVSNNLGQYNPASYDNPPRTVSQAIYRINQLLTPNPPNASANETAKNIAETLNEGQTVGAGVIPLTTPYIYY